MSASTSCLITEFGKVYTVSIGLCGEIIWTLDGNKHREGDRAAVITDNCRLYFYKNGNLHREKGPAIMWPDGQICYYLNDTYYPTKEDWEKAKEKEISVVVEMTVDEVCKALGKTVKIVKG